MTAMTAPSIPRRFLPHDSSSPAIRVMALAAVLVVAAGVRIRQWPARLASRGLATGHLGCPTPRGLREVSRSGGATWSSQCALPSRVRQRRSQRVRSEGVTEMELAEAVAALESRRRGWLGTRCGSRSWIGPPRCSPSELSSASASYGSSVPSWPSCKFTAGRPARKPAGRIGARAKAVQRGQSP